MNSEELGKKIEALDRELVRLLNERTQVALEFDKSRKDSLVPAVDQVRVDGLIQESRGPLPEKAIRSIYREIDSAAHGLGRRVCIAYLGPEATFTHQAARAHFGGSVEYQACETIGEVFTAVQKQTADFGVVPIENSTDGAVTHTLDEFTETALKICAEIYLPISHCLMANIPRENFKRLCSKPEVLRQCRRWLHENMPGIELVSASSTARAAEMVANEKDSGALASTLAAELYGLTILEQDVQDMGGNTTRFLVIGKEFGKPTKKDKTSILFTVKHKVGALYDALSVFKLYNINMTKIESRPSRAKAWEYCFFVDFEGHVEAVNIQKALEELSENCTFMTILGSYPKASGTES